VKTNQAIQGQEKFIVICSMTTLSHANAPWEINCLYSLNRLNVGTKIDGTMTVRGRVERHKARQIVVYGALYISKNRGMFDETAEQWNGHASYGGRLTSSIGR
jgi:hypothetical protein